MSSIKLESNASGTGIFTIASPNSNTNRTLTLPDATGKVVVDSSGGSVSTNTAVGINALVANTTGSYNTAFGNAALKSNTTAGDSTAIGAGALETSTGQSNTAVGAYSLNLNSTGTFNTAVGRLSLYANTTGGDNTAVGYAALDANTTGTGNVAVGINALGSNTTGINNVALGRRALETATTPNDNVGVGNYALQANTTGAANTAVGSLALAANTTGENNTAIGRGALEANTTGASNTAVGRLAADSVTTGANKTVIGHNADVGTPTGSHEIVIGSGITGQGTDYFTFGSAGNLVYNQFTANATFTRSSDERLKTDIKDMNVGLDFINKLRPVSYKWKPSNEVPEELFMHYYEQNQMNLDLVMHGFIAQEVKQALEESNSEDCGVWTIERDGTQAVSREMFIMPLVKAIQELKAINDAQATRIETLETKVAALEAK